MKSDNQLEQLADQFDTLEARKLPKAERMSAYLSLIGDIMGCDLKRLRDIFARRAEQQLLTAEALEIAAEMLGDQNGPMTQEQSVAFIRRLTPAQFAALQQSKYGAGLLPRGRRRGQS